MRYRKRWLLIAVLLVPAIGASLYTAWHEADAELSKPAATERPSLAEILEDMPDEGLDRPSGPWRLDLPDDLGAHPKTRTETWVITAHLRSARGERIGIQLALLRVALVAPGAPERASAWATRDVYRGHVIFVTEAQGNASGEERFSRAALGLAGHDAEQRRIWLEDWSIRYGEGKGGDQLELEAGFGDAAVELVLTPGKSAVATNEDGGGAPFRGFALTRLRAEGTVRRPGGRQSVSGLAWLDHLWGEVPLPVGPVVWDRLQLNLDDGTDVSLLRTRRRGGGGAPSAGGYFVDARGKVERLESAATIMEPTRAWRNDSTGARYPLHWRISTGGLVLDVAPLVNDQVHDFSAAVWSGLVTAQGRSRGRPVSGAGYLELTGYESR
jgi:predicted secreted hydrolase